ncbi:MAG: hypothetical protein KGI71_00965 [Patescibacteria group bacterium]|nr:hypothetical protein [Patescibacteria group bacterium]MDE2173411.1 hypothetical protein [Patescibacteria group bacterium]
MSWAAKRRFFILLILGAAVAAFLAVVSIATLYKTPSCTDNIQNQGEAGIDCGGPCPYLCTALEQPPTVLFTQALANGVGRIDAVALVENKNIDAAAQNVPYRLTLYGLDRSLLGDITGTLDLPPGATVPVYIPNAVIGPGFSKGGLGSQTVANAFLDIAPSAPKWFTMAPNSLIVPTVSNTTLAGTVQAPRIEAVLTNPGFTTLTNVQATVIVKDANGNVIGASRTVVPAIPAQGQTTAIFTWNYAFPGTPVSIEVVPAIQLPSPP